MKGIVCFGNAKPLPRQGFGIFEPWLSKAVALVHDLKSWTREPLYLPIRWRAGTRAGKLAGQKHRYPQTRMLETVSTQKPKPAVWHGPERVPPVTFVSSTRINADSFPAPTIMQESFLHFLWQFQYFSKANLQTVGGQPLQVIRPGLPNTDAGPDFSQARVAINHVEWAGSVEMHLRSSNWRQHRHQQDAAYENVVLHVVWHHDQAICHPDGTEIPVLCLEPFTDLTLLENYRTLLQNLASVPCAPQFGRAKDIHKRQALDKALMNRLQEKALVVNQLYQANSHDWEETAYQVLARSMGFKINAEPMLALAQSLPLKIIQKHAGSVLQTEALLSGSRVCCPPPAPMPMCRRCNANTRF